MQLLPWVPIVTFLALVTGWSFSIILTETDTRNRITDAQCSITVFITVTTPAPF